MRTPTGEQQDDTDPNSPYERHVRAGCELAEELAERMERAGVESLMRRIRRAWVEAELPSRWPDAWARIWRAVAEADPARVMSRRERRALSALPPTVTVYRGYSGEGARGWSWTRRRDVAEDFAVRYDEPGKAGDPSVCVAELDTSTVIALLLLGNEEEVIIDPDRIEWTRARIEPIGPTTGL